MAAVIAAVALLASLPAVADASPAHKPNPDPHYVKIKPKPLVQPVVKVALRYVGTPYVWGGTTPAGFDCSGFTGYVLREVGIKNLPRTTYGQISYGRPIANLAAAKAGDLLFAHTGHVALYLGKGRAIHSPRSGLSVHTYKAAKRSYIAIRRPPGAWKRLTRPKPPKRVNRHRTHARGWR